MSAFGPKADITETRPDHFQCASLSRYDANRVAQRVKRITGQAEDLLNPDLFEYIDQDVSYHLSHLSLLRRLAKSWHRADRRPT